MNKAINQMLNRVTSGLWPIIPPDLDMFSKAMARNLASSRVRLAARLLGLMKDRRAVPILIRRLESPGISVTDRNNRDSFAEALSDITGQDFGMNSNLWQEWWATQD